jgi:hypothetical protein
MALLPVLLAAAPGASTLAAPLEIAARPVPLHAEDPERERIGSLRFRGGLDLTSPDPRFGGFSPLLLSENGALLAIADGREEETASPAFLWREGA